MPALPSPPVPGRQPTTAPKTSLSRTSTVTRRPGSAASVRRPTSTTSAGGAAAAAAAARNGTPKAAAAPVAATSRLQLAKARGSSDKENTAGSKVVGSGVGRTGSSRPTGRRQSSAASTAREKLPSKDGTAQRNAKEVEGLKEFSHRIVFCIFYLRALLDDSHRGEVLHTAMSPADFSQQLGDCIGRGAFGSVYRALNWSTGETVAIKQVSLAHLPRGDLTVIMQEIDLLKNLNHRNIVKYHGFVKSVENLYIILEYCENGSLHSICKNFGKFPENLVSLYTAQVLQGLLFLHEQGVIHRDIKGANILTTKEGLVKLADFGVATKQADGSSVVGTPYWMAPEVIELSGASTASDIWSLGCTVIELLDGKPPYHKFAPMPALFRIVNDDHPPLPEGVSPLVRDFLMQCFQKDPNLRVSAKKLLRHPWILGTRKGEAVKPVVKHEEAVGLVEEWNNALKSSPKAEPGAAGEGQRSSARPGSRPISRNNALDASKAKLETPAGAGARGVYHPGAAKKPEKPTPQLFASPDDDEGRDNWDEDFASLSSSFHALALPEHRRPPDHFAGLFTAARLKQYASDAMPEMDGKVEQWDEEFPDGELTVRSPLLGAKGDALETVRPFCPPRATSDESRHRPASGLAKLGIGGPPRERKGSKDSQPKTQILRSAHKPTTTTTTAAAKTVATSHAHPAKKASTAMPAAPANKDRFREEEDDEDYSDLVPHDETAFQRKLAGFSPSRPYNPRDLRHIKTGLAGGSVRRRTHTPTSLVHDAAAMKRTRSSVEMQKYAEDDEEGEDFTDVIFGDEGDGGEGETPIRLLQPMKQRSPQSASMGSDSSGSGTGTMKLAGSWVRGDGGAGEEEDDEEEDDPFAALEGELDAVDLESNVARDKHARLCTLVEGLVSDLKLSKPDEVLDEIVEQLLHILSESPDVQGVIVSSHGMLPLLEILEACARPATILRLLRIVNGILGDNVEVQENLCFVGGIPIVTQFAHKKYSSEIRLEAASFVRAMYQTSTLTLQMFVSCGGLNVLVEFLEEDYETEAGRELVLLGVNGVWSVFELQGPTPKNDFCRIFSRSSVLYPLSLVLSRILDEEGEMAVVFEGRIVNIFLLFSQAENHVKETVADRMVLKRVLKDLRRMSPQHQITMLKFIKNLSMLATTLDALHNSNAIEVLTDLLGALSRDKAPHFREVSNQVLNTMYNLCRLSKARQEDAALNGLVPLLQRLVQTERPLKEFALPILCDMAHSGKVGRMVLWQNKGLQFYVRLLADPYWAVTALDAIFIWLQEETHKVEQHLLATSAFADAITQCFCASKADVFETLLEPLQKLLRLSRAVAAGLAQRTLFERCAVKLHARKPLVRLNLLRILRSICEAHESQGALMKQWGLLESVRGLSTADPAILVREMAKALLECTVDSRAGAARGPGLGRRSSSAAVSLSMTPSPAGSMPPTPSADRAGSRGGFFDFGVDVPRSRPVVPSSPYRSDVAAVNSTTAAGSGANAPAAPATSLASPAGKAIRASQPRLSVANLRPPAQSRLRVSVAVPERDKAAGAESTPTHVPPNAATRGSSSAFLANARRRRQTSGAELGRWA
ncbi:Protein kinase of the Mitotic Exit Network [Teratosphaeriaceae sp. CCFEE 6253]|nr:Protein kinase of the Mitotic Exit Network [Teratosphaeriaceae sp. CCFEE 6253]